MELLVCIKQVPDDSAEIRLKPDTQEPALEGITPVVNPFDTYALEMAVRLKEANGGRVTVLSAGPEKARDGIKICLSVGADQGFLLDGTELSPEDILGKSRALAAGINNLAQQGRSFDLILCGREATDRASGQTGPQLAEALGLPVVTDGVEITPTDTGVRIKQETEDGYRLIDAPLPCVVTVSKPPYDPRYPTIKSKMAARKAEIPLLEGEKAAPGPQLRVIGLHEPAKRKGGVTLPEMPAEDAARKAVEMMAEAKVL